MLSNSLERHFWTNIDKTELSGDISPKTSLQSDISASIVPASPTCRNRHLRPEKTHSKLFCTNQLIFDQIVEEDLMATNLILIFNIVFYYFWVGFRYFIVFFTNFHHIVVS